MPAPDPAVLHLLGVARCRDDAGDVEPIASLSAADWEALLAAARAHGMLGLLHRRTASCGPGVVPRSAAATLAAAYRAGATRGLRQEIRLREVIGHLQKAGIACVPFKGPLLAILVYGDVAMRYPSDLDLLVASADVGRAAETLVGAGWRLASQSQTAQHDLLEAAECELLLEHVASGLFLELHWRTGPRFARASFPAEPLISAARPCHLLGREAACLRDDDHFLVLCVHGATHRWVQLELVCTIAEFIATGLISDWSALLQRATATGCRRRVLVAAALAHGLFGVALSPPVAAALAVDRGAERLALVAAAELCAEPGPLTGADRIKAVAWQAMALDTRGARLRHLIARVVIPGGRDLDWLAIPRSLWAVYYLFRPLRLAAAYLRKAAHAD